MCLYPKPPVDLLDQLFVHNSCCTFSDNCDYLTVDNQIKLEQDDLVVLQLNIRGLFSKTEELKRLLYNSFKDKTPDVILLCETWMSANSPDVKLPG